MKVSNCKDLAKATVNALVYGPAGVGKTSLAATTGHKTLIVSAEGGLLSLRGADVDYVEVRNIDVLKEAYQFIRANEAGYGTVMLDSVSEIAETILEHEKAKAPDPRQAYGALQTEVTRLLKAFRDLAINVVFVCKQDRITDSASGMLLHGPMMPGTKLGPQLPYICDVVCAMRIVEGRDGQPVRALQTVQDGQYDAKDRTGRLPPLAPANLQEIYSLINS